MNPDRFCDNRTPAIVRAFAMDDRHGRDVLVVVAKIAFAVGQDGVARLAARPSPVRLAGHPSGKHANASAFYPPDDAPEKPGTDVILLGTAYPEKREPTFRDVTLRVNSRQRDYAKTVRVHGLRVWQRGVRGVAPGPARPLQPTPLLWELAYGGIDTSDPERYVVHPTNPHGSGFTRAHESLVHTLAPALEGKDRGIDDDDQGPACFAPIGCGVEPRASRAGTLGEAWRRSRAPIRPLDFDPRWYSVVPDDQWFEAPLRGDEPVEVTGVTDGAPLRFQLPAWAPKFVTSAPHAKDVDLETHLDTFLIDADERRVELTWRARTPIPKRDGLLEPIRVYNTVSTFDLPREAGRPRPQERAS